MKENEAIGRFEGQRPDLAEEGSCAVYKSLCGDVIYLCWESSDTTTCVVEQMSIRLFDKYVDHDLLWVLGAKSRPISSVAAVTLPHVDLTLELPEDHDSKLENFIWIPEKTAAMEKNMYHDLRELYTNPSTARAYYEVPYDNETNENELNVQAFTHPAHNSDVNNPESMNKSSRHDFIEYGSHGEGFQLLLRYDRLGAIAKIFDV